MKLPKIVWHPADKYFLFTALLSLYIIPNLLAEPTVPSYVTNSLLLYQLGWMPMYSLGRFLDSYESEETQLFFIGVICFVNATAVYGLGIDNWFPVASLVFTGFPAVIIYIYRTQFSPRAKENNRINGWMRHYGHIYKKLPPDDFDFDEYIAKLLPMRSAVANHTRTIVGMVNDRDNQLTREDVLNRVRHNVGIETLPNDIIEQTYVKHGGPQYLDRTCSGIRELYKELPPEVFLSQTEAERGRPWRDYYIDHITAIRDGKGTKEDERIKRALFSIPKEMADFLGAIPITTTIPPYHGHTHIVAGTGWGKTQLIQSKLVEDIQGTDAIVVIDSQERMIQNIAKVATIPEERLVLIDPTDIEYPPSLALFSFAGKNAHDPLQKEQAINSALEMYEYIFSALDATMTSKQATAYRYLARLMFEIPGANIHTLREMLEPGADIPYDRLGTVAQSFFKNEYNSKEFAETRKQVLRRLYALLDNRVFEQMFAASESKLDIKKEIDRGAIILVNTAKSFLSGTGSSIFGRFWIGQITQAIFQNSKRTKVYIDEFHEYASESYLNVLLEQGRKYGLELTVAHQALAQLNPKMVAALASNTTAQYVGGVNASDARALSSIMRTDADTIMEQPKGSFMVHVQDVGTIPYQVPLGVMEALPQRQSIQSVREEMRRRYSSPNPKSEPKPDEQLSSEPIQSEDKLTKW